jgi:hypothetical protein
MGTATVTSGIITSAARAWRSDSDPLPYPFVLPFQRRRQGAACALAARGLSSSGAATTGLDLLRVLLPGVALMASIGFPQNDRRNCRPPNSGGRGNFVAFRFRSKPIDARPACQWETRIEAPLWRPPSKKTIWAAFSGFTLRAFAEVTGAASDPAPPPQAAATLMTARTTILTQTRRSAVAGPGPLAVIHVASKKAECVPQRVKHWLQRQSRLTAGLSMVIPGSIMLAPRRGPATLKPPKPDG